MLIGISNILTRVIEKGIFFLKKNNALLSLFIFLYFDFFLEEKKITLINE
jgi:hypothetical protein